MRPVYGVSGNYRALLQGATSEIVKAALDFGQPTWSAVQTIIEPLEESLDFKAARIPVAVYNYEPERVECVAEGSRGRVAAAIRGNYHS